MDYSVEELQAFEKWCIDEFYKGNIRSPIHLSGSIDGHLEEELIKIFKEVKPQDWVFTTYRSHYHALLKGMPKERLKKWILDNKSIHVMDKENKIVSTAIVGGQLSQAVGCAMSIKLRNGKEHVWVFCGDMAASLGNFRDCVVYSLANKLPITFVIEDNGLSTDTPTSKAWGMDTGPVYLNKNVIYFQYKRKYAHYGPEKEGEERSFILT